MILELSSVAKTFGDQVVLSSTDLTIVEGSFVSIVGTEMG